MRTLRESDILKQITDGLTAHRIWWMRCNSGGMFGSHNGKRWAVKFGRKGMADLLAIRREFSPQCRSIPASGSSASGQSAGRLLTRSYSRRKWKQKATVTL
jgi:hypothetical protein